MAAIVLAVSEVLKKTFNLNTQYMPITSVVIGIFIGLVLWPLGEKSSYTEKFDKTGGFGKIKFSGAITSNINLSTIAMVEE